jgi:type II secretory pathway component PulJ
MSVKNQKGLSILEILIGIFISFIIIVAIISLLSNTISGSQRVLDRGKLDRDLFAAMDVMTYDIQRAGFWINATNSNSTNPFMSGTNLMTTNASANCITFAYDTSTDGTNSTTDQFGYGLSGNAIQFRQGGTTCASTGAGSGWSSLTDTNVITISNFQVTTTNVGVNVGTSTNTTRYRTVTISLTGNLKSDASNTRSITRTIKVYNNQYST